MVARTRLNVKLLHTLPVWLSHHYAYSAFLVNQFTAQNAIHMQIFLQSNHNQPSDNVFIEICSSVGQINLTNIFSFHQNTEQDYFNLTTHKHLKIFSSSLQVLTWISIGRKIAFVHFIRNALIRILQR